MPAPTNESTAPVILWFRDDLRLSDNGALLAAIASGNPLICAYVFDECSPGIRKPGGAARWWLHHSLARLGGEIAALGGRLDIFAGAGAAIVLGLARAAGARAVHWTRRYGEAERAVDAALKIALKDSGIAAESHNGSLLCEPWQVKTKAGSDFRVFTPFWKAVRTMGDPPAPLPAPQRLSHCKLADDAPQPVSLASLGLLPAKPDWAGGLRAMWSPGEAGAQTRLADFVAGGARGYAANRNRPDLPSTSRLSPHLRFGEVSPRQVFHAAMARLQSGDMPSGDAEKFLSELGWREFSYNLLYHFPKLATQNLQSRFNAFAWMSANPHQLAAWQSGRTGFPIVDAGMRELWQTGFMHNRVRMICASFLIKDLMIDWRSGEAWFWDTLCDADPASNAASWQWVAGSGADAAPYYRVFNPMLQGQKFDPAGDYVRRFVPELARLGSAHIHCPGEAPAEVLRQAGITLGKTYPLPIVDHAIARQRALAAFAALGRDEI